MPRLRAVLGEVGELQELPQADDVVADRHLGHWTGAGYGSGFGCRVGHDTIVPRLPP